MKYGSTLENLAYLVAVNRVGSGGGLDYDGGSTAWSPWGESLTPVGTDPVIVEVEPGQVARVLAKYPFLDDMRG